MFYTFKKKDIRLPRWFRLVTRKIIKQRLLYGLPIYEGDYCYLCIDRIVPYEKILNELTTGPICWNTFASENKKGHYFHKIS